MMEEKESKIQKIKHYFLRNKVLSIVCVALIVCVLSMNGTVYAALNEKESLSNELIGQTEKYERLHDDFEVLKDQYEDLQKNYTVLETKLKDYKDQQQTIDDLNGKLTKLQKQYDELSSKNDSIQSQAVVKKSSNSTDSSGGSMVWLSATGEKYHSIPNCGRMNPNNARQVSKSSAIAQGYDACGNCW